MASLHLYSRLILWCALAFMNSAASAAISISTPYPAIFVFGDSMSDSGNRAIASNSSTYTTFQLPYGETFPGWPFGRYSDGHTIVDFLAAYMGLPLLNPYLNSSADFGAGVNYAVGGASALDITFLNSLGIYPDTNLSLDVQVELHLAYKASVEASNGSRDATAGSTSTTQNTGTPNQANMGPTLAAIRTRNNNARGVNVERAITLGKAKRPRIQKSRNRPGLNKGVLLATLRKATYLQRRTTSS